MKYKYTAHPWHGISYGDDAPNVVTVFVEIVPRDTVKYEIDKESGFITIDRPQQYSNVVPTNYGFIPQTYCGDGIAKLASENAGRSIEKGDGDPLDILVLSEHHIPRGNILLKAEPIGGFCLLDDGEADDKIIATLKGDKVYDQYNEISQLPKGILERIEHYFLTYKNLPDEPQKCEIAYSYGKERANHVINTSIEDYTVLKNTLEETS